MSTAKLLLCTLCAMVPIYAYSPRAPKLLPRNNLVQGSTFCRSRPVHSSGAFKGQICFLLRSEASGYPSRRQADIQMLRMTMEFDATMVLLAHTIQGAPAQAFSAYMAALNTNGAAVDSSTASSLYVASKLTLSAVSGQRQVYTHAPCLLLCCRSDNDCFYYRYSKIIQ